ncbi:LLM class F420-dependent oxidoreductase [Nocardioides sp. YIM 152315]|uniref:LLM class F420-dependent oxidoreductase n=1 Tax=Nocardioides sp. YIM 152315 TaxID=3031760 RepID=UPI0023D9C7D3|nr:LLM class F420-dependent oxidoreductase [Nocardioides sp. YIM 152315]MDF1602566.1 LLM class F420-dependent oxidoreductase [Nocardioides sp. YIM 152315]
MKLGLQLGYWGAQPPQGVAELVSAAEEAGFDAVFAAEAWGSDAFTPLAWWGRETSRIGLGTSIVQMSGRAPTSIAMHVMTLDHLSGGRVILGMGVSGPQVVEGWYGQPFGKPLARTREVVDIIRKVLAREAPVTNDGPHYPLPFRGDNSVGLGKPLKPIVHPLRSDVPIWLGAEGPKNVAQTAEIADGWIPIFYTPKSAGMYRPWLDEGFARPGARHSAPWTDGSDFEIAATCHLQVVDSAEEKAAVLDAMRPFVSLYMGGMGAKEANFHNQVFVRMGYEDLAAEVQKLYLGGEKDRATALIPDELVDDMHIVGTAGEVKERVAQWEETGVTTLLLSCRSADEVRSIAELLA